MTNVTSDHISKCTDLAVRAYHQWSSAEDPYWWDMDDWEYEDGYDINIFKDPYEDILRVTMYPVSIDQSGYGHADTSNYVPVITIELGNDGIFTFNNLINTQE